MGGYIDERRARKRACRTAAAIVLASGQLLIAAQSTAASCNPNRAHDNAARYVITFGSPAGLDGVTANIEEYNPFYTGANSTGTNATVMLANAAGSKWAQFGWFKSEINGGVVTREAGIEFYLDASHNFWSFYGPEPIGQLTRYMIEFTPPNTYKFYLAGNATAIKTHVGAFTPTQYQMFGETHDRADQMPGGTDPSARVDFQVANYRKSGVYFAMAGAMQPDPLFGGAKIANGHYRIWDLKCIA